MKLTSALILAGLTCLGVEVEGKIRFLLPSSYSDDYSKSLNGRESSSGSSSSTSTSSSEVELLRDDSDADGRFKNLRKDDDLLALKKEKKKKRRRRRSRVRGGSSDTRPDEESGKRGGKQESGFIYNREWQKDMEKVSQNEKHFNGYIDEKMTEGTVTEPVNAGWWLLSFQTGKSVSKTVFKFKANLPVKVTLVDLFCRGDSFAVWDDGKLIAQSSRIRADRECEELVISPQVALIDGRWSSVVFELDIGEHFIEIKTVDSPMETGGVAAIKFESILPAGMKERRISRDKVCRGYNGLFVVKADINSEEAETVCLTMKSDLAKFEVGDLAAWKSMNTCLGVDGMAWVIEKETGDLGTVALNGRKIKILNDNRSKPVICRVRS
jgi:hypothetical protein